MDKIVKQEAGNKDEESFNSHIAITNEPGASEVLVKQEAGNEDEESFMSRITIKNEPGTSEVVVKQEEDLPNSPTESYSDDQLISEHTNSSVPVAKEIPLKMEYAENDHHDGAILITKPPQTNFIICSGTEDHLKEDILEHRELIDSGENEGIVLHSSDAVQNYVDISKTGLIAVSDAIKVETHINTYTKTRDTMCELKITRMQTVLPEEVASEFMEDPGQKIIVKPVKDKSLTQMASKEQKVDPKKTNNELTIGSGGHAQCNVCHKCFRKPNQLKMHAKIHTGEKPYKCQVCNKSFTLKNNLTVHEWIHSGEKPYKCQVCNKSFTSKNNLTVHERIHSGEKPYKCQVCNKSSTLKNNLVAHEQIHSGEKPYKCQVCNKSFTLKNNLIKHERIHSGEKPYKCKVCNKLFAEKSNLAKHERIHSGEKLYTCQLSV